MLRVFYSLRALQTTKPIVTSHRKRRQAKHPVIKAYVHDLYLLSSYQLYNMNGWRQMPIYTEASYSLYTFFWWYSATFETILSHLPDSPQDFLILPLLAYITAWICVLPYLLFKVVTTLLKLLQMFLYLLMLLSKYILQLDFFVTFWSATWAVYYDHDILSPRSWWKLGFLLGVDLCLIATPLQRTPQWLQLRGRKGRKNRRRMRHQIKSFRPRTLLQKLIFFPWFGLLTWRNRGRIWETLQIMLRWRLEQ